MVPSPARSTAVLSAAVAAALALAACGGGSDTAAGSDYTPVVATSEYAIRDLLPGNSQNSNIDRALFTPLTQVDGSGELTNAVAESIESTDQKTWTITIADGWTFHDGSPVTAQSFADSWNSTALGSNALLNNASMAIFEGYADLNPESGEASTTTMSGVRVVDDSTLEVTLTTADRFFPYTLSASAFAPIPEGAADDLSDFATHPIGDGPFAARDGGWDAGAQDIYLDRYDDYAGDPAATGSVDVRVYEATDSFYTDFQAGQIDVALLDGDQLAGAQAEVPDQVLAVDFPAVVYLGFPLSDERFADPKLRQAFGLAIDRDAIVDSLLTGQGTASTGLAPDSFAGADEITCTSCAYDPDTAKQLLAQAGGFSGKLTLQTYPESSTTAVVEAIANQLHDNLGIETDFETVAIDQLYQDLLGGDGKGPFLLYAGSAYPHVVAQAQALLKTGGLLNVTGYSDPDVDAALADAAAESDDAQATSDTAAAISTAMADVPLTPIYHPKGGLVHSEQVTDLSADFLGGVDLASLSTGD